MGDLADLVRPRKHIQPSDETPVLMDGRILDVDPLTVLVRDYDDERTALRAFGKLPDEAAVDDPVMVQIDRRGRFVVVAWEPGG